ncbi:MAG: glycine cleavage system protein GcvH [Dehalococcoidia bacterium]
MEIPSDLKYTKEHEWLRMEGEQAVIGITDFAQDSLGDVVYVQLPEPGANIEQFAKFGEIESVKAVSDLFSPIGGDVVERNAALDRQPELVNSEPYSGGWLLRLTPADAAQIDQLMSAADYEALTASG